MTRLLTVTLMSSACGQENTTNTESHKQMSWRTPLVGSHSHPAITQRLPKLPLMVSASDDCKLSNSRVGGKRSVLFILLTQFLLSRVSDRRGGWAEGETRNSCFPDRNHRGLNPVHDPSPSWPGSQFCCQQLMALNVFIPFIFDVSMISADAPSRPNRLQWIGNCRPRGRKADPACYSLV